MRPSDSQAETLSEAHARMTYRLLELFNNWFTSAGGVWQTAVVTLGIAILELADRHLDPNGFLLLYWLTVYSAVTQPALAYSGRQSSDQLTGLFHRVASLEEDMASDAERDRERSKLILMYLVAWHHDTHGDKCHCWAGKGGRADELLDLFLTPREEELADGGT